MSGPTLQHLVCKFLPLPTFIFSSIRLLCLIYWERRLLSLSPEALNKQVVVSGAQMASPQRSSRSCCHSYQNTFLILCWHWFYYQVFLFNELCTLSANIMLVWQSLSKPKGSAPLQLICPSSIHTSHSVSRPLLRWITPSPFPMTSAALIHLQTMGIPSVRSTLLCTPGTCQTSHLAPRRIVQGSRISRVRESSAWGSANYFLMWRRFFWRAADQIFLKASWGCRRENTVAGHTRARGGARVTPCLPGCIVGGTARLHCRHPLLLLSALSLQSASTERCSTSAQKLWHQRRGCTHAHETLHSTNGYKCVFKEIPGLPYKP